MRNPLTLLLTYVYANCLPYTLLTILYVSCLCQKCVFFEISKIFKNSEKFLKTSFLGVKMAEKHESDVKKIR